MPVRTNAYFAVAAAMFGALGCDVSRRNDGGLASSAATSAPGSEIGSSSNAGASSTTSVSSAPSALPSVTSNGIAVTPQGTVIERPSYTLTYPTKWKLDEKDDDYDLDHYFSIDAPGQCHITFFFFDDKIDEKAHLDAHDKAVKERVFKGSPEETSFSTWGSLTGRGNELRGRMKPVGKGRIRHFAHAGARRSVFVDEFCFDEDLPSAQAGFDSVAASFRMR